MTKRAFDLSHSFNASLEHISEAEAKVDFSSLYAPATHTTTSIIGKEERYMEMLRRERDFRLIEVMEYFPRVVDSIIDGGYEVCEVLAEIFLAYARKAKSSSVARDVIVSACKMGNLLLEWDQRNEFNDYGIGKALKALMKALPEDAQLLSAATPFANSVCDDTSCGPW